jgi:predicted nucleic acid-binding protein
LIRAAPFLDSNILLYAYFEDARSSAAKAVCDQPYTISVQSLNEFANVARRKMNYGWEDILPCLNAIINLADRIVPLSLELHKVGVALASRYQLQVYDGMILAAALEAGCETLYSEDMQHGMVIEDLLTIRNPFA